MTTSTKQLKRSMVQYINENTHFENLEEKSTKQVAEYFSIDMKTAYSLLMSLAHKGTKEILHLSPVNGQNLECCGWIRKSDN